LESLKENPKPQECLKLKESPKTQECFKESLKTQECFKESLNHNLKDLQYYPVREIPSNPKVTREAVKLGLKVIQMFAV